MFTGKYTHSIDDKGRVVLPSSIRSKFGGSDTCYVAPGIDGQITINRATEFQAFLQAAAVAAESEEERRRVRRMAQEAVEQKLDKAGRIVVPEGLRQHAGIELASEVVVTGAVTHAEIWNTELHRRDSEAGGSELIQSRLAKEAKGS